jgi:hypothetical protein
MNEHDKAVGWSAALESKEAEMVEVLQKHAYDKGFTAGLERAKEIAKQTVYAVEGRLSFEEAINKEIDV